MADHVDLNPFGVLSQQQVSRIPRSWAIRSSSCLRWEIVDEFFEEAFKEDPVMKDLVKQSMVMPNTDHGISKSEFDSNKEKFDNLHEMWSKKFKGILQDLLPLLKAWKNNERRGMFRYLVLFTILLLSKTANRDGSYLHNKKLGGMIKKRLLDASENFIDAKAGSLYSAMDRFKERSMVKISHLGGKKTEMVELSVKASKFLKDGLEIINKMLEKVDQLSIHEIYSQDVINRLDAFLEASTLQLEGLELNARVKEKYPVIIQQIVNFKHLIYDINSQSPFKDIRVENSGDNQRILDWKSDLNRGLIDIFILGILLKRPSYGNEIIAKGKEGLDFKAGTLYPKLQEWCSAGLIRKVARERVVNIIERESYPKRGPDKKFYDLTLKGAIYYLFIFTFFLKDMMGLFNLFHDFLKVSKAINTKQETDHKT
ncbi:MAG: PadR family transcriptional regulator [Promethearchaeota archaeon]